MKGTRVICSISDKSSDKKRALYVSDLYTTVNKTITGRLRTKPDITNSSSALLKLGYVQ